MKMTTTKTLLTALASTATAFAFAFVAPGTQAATITPDATSGMQSNGFGNSFFGPGTAGGGNFLNSALIGFRVQDILTEAGISVGDLSSNTATLSFDTDGSIDLEAANGTPSNPAEYVITYAGFYANTGGGAPFATALLSSNVAVVNTGVVDTLAAQIGISGDFTLSDVAEGDSADDWIAFRVEYKNPYFQQSSNTIQPISNVTLTVVPEPGSLALLGLGGLLIASRRRRG